MTTTKDWGNLVRLISESTRKALDQYVAQCDSLRDAARRLDVAAGTISDIRNGRDRHVSLETENAVRVALGLNEIGYRNHKPPRPWLRVADMEKMKWLGMDWREIFELGLEVAQQTMLNSVQKRAYPRDAIDEANHDFDRTGG